MRKTILYLFAVMFCLPVFGQQDIISMLNRKQYLAKVKTIDEFMARFNGTRTKAGLAKETNNRKTNIMLLFDLSKVTSKQDSIFKQIDKFASSVIQDSVTLHYSDSCWLAKVKCHGKLQGKNTEFWMSLKVEKRGEDMYKWVISDVEGELFKTSRDKEHKELFILPNEHEQFFSSLSKLSTETYKFIDDYLPNGFKSPALAAFTTMMRNRYLTIDYVSDITFIFNHVPGYVFTIKHFERESENAGWLIDTLKINETK